MVLDSSKIDADYGFALDSDGKVGDIITAAPTQAKVNAKIFGKTAHAGVAPEKGVSAITIASKAIAKMHSVGLMKRRQLTSDGSAVAVHQRTSFVIM